MLLLLNPQFDIPDQEIDNHELKKSFNSFFLMDLKSEMNKRGREK